MKPPLLTIKSGSYDPRYDQTFVEQTKETENDCWQLRNASLMSGLKLLSVTKGKFDT